MFNKEFVFLKSNSDKSSPKYGYMLDKVPNNVLNDLLSDANAIKNDFSSAKRANHTLAGHIAHEYKYEPSSGFIEYIDDLTRYYEVKSNNFIKNYFWSIPISDSRPPEISKQNHYIPDLKIDSLWINYQQKYEYNPIHNHSGILSFVIWLEVPYKKEKEVEFAVKRGIDLHASMGVGDFNFIYPEFDKCNYFPIEADKSYNGIICMFPSKLQHYVNPFYTSDDYRISVAGNLYFKDFEQNFKNFLK